MATYPYLGINGDYLHEDFLKGVEEEIVSMIPAWQAGIVKPTQCETFAYHILNLIKRDGNWPTQLNGNVS